MKGEVNKRRSEVKVEPKRKTRLYGDVENLNQCVTAKIVTHIAVQRGGKRRALVDVNNLGVPETKCRKIDRTKAPATVEGKTTQIATKPTRKAATRKVVKTASVECKVPDKKLENSRLPCKEEDVVTGRAEKLRQQNETTFSVECYAKDIYKYLFEMEKRYQLPSNHLDGQVINGSMRALMIDWLASVAHHIDLLQDTFQLAVYVLDKFMTIDRTISRTNAQLVSIGALFVAAKYEEMEVIVLEDLISVCNGAWSSEEIKLVESTILNAISYQMGRPLAIQFIRRFSKIGEATPMEHNYAKYFADVSLLAYQLCTIKPSTIAAAAIYLAFCVSRGRVDSRFWTPQLTMASTYRLADFSHVLPVIARTVVNAETKKLNEMRTHYSSPHLFCVSLMPGCRPATGVINQFCLV